MSSPPHKRKVPPQNYKAPLLKTFWRRFWLQKIFSLAAKVWESACFLFSYFCDDENLQVCLFSAVTSQKDGGK